MAVSSAHSILALIVFLLTNLVGVFPFKVSVPVPSLALVLAARTAVHLRVCQPSDSCCEDHPKLLERDEKPRAFFHWHRVTVGFQTAPLAAVLLLLAAGVLHGREIREGITGTSGIEPLDIMALFISLAYLAVSLDVTGLFRFLAFWVVRKGGSSGRRLYLYLYSFFFVSGVFVGNDPVVLFGTPFLAYFSRASGIVPPTAWVSAQFIAANTASAVLPSSNLTNLVLTGAFGFSFVSYAARSIVPTFVTAIAIFPLLSFILFKSREKVPREIELVDLQSPTSDYRSAELPPSTSVGDMGQLKDKHGAIFGSVLLGITLAVLVGTSPLKIPVWRVTVPPAIIMMGRDIWHDRYMWSRRGGIRSTQNGGEQEKAEAIPTETSGAITPKAQDKKEGTEVSYHRTYTTTSMPSKKEHATLQELYTRLRNDKLPTLLAVLPRLPISLVLFAFCMFILVQALSTWGWVEVFGHWWASWIHVCQKVGDGFAVVGAIYGMLVISTILCNLCGTNIGTTILLARVLQNWLDNSTSIDSKIRLGSIYALALGTNFGAYTFSFSASLAGLLWRDILRQKGFIISQRQFATYNLPVIALAIIVAGAVLIAEVYVVPN